MKCKNREILIKFFCAGALKTYYTISNRREL
nr:MAG TPA: hypothetical protein [Caudoviricetes sp.]